MIQQPLGPQVMGWGSSSTQSAKIAAGTYAETRGWMVTGPFCNTGYSQLICNHTFPYMKHKEDPENIVNPTLGVGKY